MGTKPPRSLAGATRLLDLFATKEGARWWEEHGVALKMTFDPRPDSPNNRAWTRHLATKGSAGR